MMQSPIDFTLPITGRRVFLHGDVDEGTIGLAIRGMYALSDLDESAIELYVSSYGGDLDEAFALHDVTRTIGVPVHTVALGKCMSAAPLLVACGKKGERYGTENCSFMLHDAILYPSPDSAANLTAHAKVTESMVRRYAELLERYTVKDARHWRRIFASKTDRFFGAEQALDWGLIDTIWSEKD